MIIVDLTQVLIASLMASTRGGTEPINEDLVRHIALKNIAMYRKRYHKTYGEIVLADDSGKVRSLVESAFSDTATSLGRNIYMPVYTCTKTITPRA